MLDLLLASVAVLAVASVALARPLERAPVSLPLLALVAGVLLGPGVAGLLDVPTLVEAPDAWHQPSRVLLALSVMGVALRYPLRDARAVWRPVVLLLVVVMPAMALLTAVVASWALALPLAAALLVGAACAPTDPVLASSVVTGEAAERDVPARVRRVVSLESGANDGLALPVVLVAVAVAGASTGAEAAWTSLREVGGAVLVGVAAGALTGVVLQRAEARRVTEEGPRLLVTAVLALGTLGACGALHLDGVLGAFVAGLAFNAAATGRDRTEDLQVDEAFNRLAVLPLLLVLGAALPWEEWAGSGLGALWLALGALLLRRLPVVLLLARPLGLPLRQALFVGWFGPVGVSALFYAVLEHREGVAADAVLAAVTLVVVASTLVHGVTTLPARRWLRRRARAGGT